MKNLTVDASLMATSAPFELISHEKAVVKLEAGCLWTHVLHDSERVGIAFAGPSEFTVDAITETNRGAVGSSVSGPLKGVQIFFGKADMESVSGPASDNVISDRGYTDAAAFLHGVNETLKRRLDGGRRVQVTKSSDAILLGCTEQDKAFMLIVKPSGLVFTGPGSVFIDDEGRTISVGKAGLALRDRDGRSLLLGGEGITELDELEDLGPTVQKAVQMICGLGSLKALRGLDHIMGNSSCCGHASDFEDE